MLACLALAGVLAGCSADQEGALITAADARNLCEQALRSASADPSLVQVPPQEARETVNVFSFRWRVGDRLIMPNDQGTPVEAVATCRVNKETRQIAHLEFEIFTAPETPFHSDTVEGL